MENAVVQQIRKRITRSKFGEIFFVSSFPKYDVEYVTKLLAIFEKESFIYGQPLAFSELMEKVTSIQEQFRSIKSKKMDKS